MLNKDKRDGGPGFDPQPMVGWFDARQLAQTGILAVISSVFGSFADKREMIAAVNDVRNEEDYSGMDEVWVDYISDMGDGFDSTYSMASLVAQRSLEVKGVATPMPKAKVLVLGGDMVYPTASREEYNNRFIGPYERASPKNKLVEEDHMYAVPGNHDWYDGLTNFSKLFLQDRSVGNWRTKQNRSYFVMKVTANTWIWAIDIQFEADIDHPQLRYFDDVVKMMQTGDKVILCSAEPSWIFSNSKNGDKSYHNLRFFEMRYFSDDDEVRCNKDVKPELILSLAGDLHHYARYTKGEGDKAYHKITSGGGGAFMHPTHNLPEYLEKLREGEKDWVNGIEDKEKAFKLKSSFPSKAASKSMLWGNIMFPFKNKQFGFFMAAVYLVFAWVTDIASKISSHGLVNMIKDMGIGEACEVLKQYALTFTISPASVIIAVLMIFGLGAFCDTASTKKKWVGVVGYIHGLCHLVLVCSLLWLFAYVNKNLLQIENEHWMTATILAEMLTIGGYLASVLMGTYLMLTNRLLQIHDNEAYSSLKITGYKNFLRMCFKNGTLTIYPVGVKQTAKWAWSKDKQQFTTTDKLAPELIEQPIIINLK